MRIFLCSFAILFMTLLFLHGPHFIVEDLFITKLLGVIVVSVACSLTARHFYYPRIKTSAKKAILITGCDTGFGHHLAKRMETQGFTVFACCLNAGSEDSKQLESGTGLMHVLQMDVTNNDQIEACFNTVMETLRKDGKHLWAVVNNAGIGELGFIEMLPIEAYQRSFNVNTLGPIRVSKAFIPLLRGHGRVINVTSLMSRFNFQYFSSYSMSKHATLAFSDSLRLEMSPFNIKVVTVEPTFYDTRIVATEQLSSMFDKSWNSTKKTVRDEYGILFVKACENRIREQIIPRTDIKEVIDTIERAVWAIEPALHYVPHLPTAFKIKLYQLLPEYILDQKMNEAWFPKEIEPAFVSRSSSS